MVMTEQILNIVIQAVHDFAEQEGDKDELLNPIPETRLFGVNGHLDSLGLVALITEVEEQIDEQLGQEIILADERAMAQQRSPFRSIQALADYITLQINEPDR